MYAADKNETYWSEPPPYISYISAQYPSDMQRDHRYQVNAPQPFQQQTLQQFRTTTGTASPSSSSRLNSYHDFLQQTTQVQLHPEQHSCERASSPSPSPSIELNQNELDSLTATLQWIPSAPSTSTHQSSLRLPKPIAISQVEPQTFRSGPMPFTRAYAPILAHFSIDAPTFLSFVDNLTIAMAPSPPIQAVQVIGTGIGSVPHHWAQLASAGIGLAAGAGGAAVSVARTKKFIQVSNEKYFVPRGLKVRTVSDEQLEDLLSQRPSSSSYSSLDSNARMYLAPTDPRNPHCTTLAERRLTALCDRVETLVLDGLPPPALGEKNFIDRLSGKQVEKKIKKNKEKALKKARKQEESDEDRREKMEEKVGKEKKDGKKAKERRKDEEEAAKKTRERMEDDVQRVKKLKWIVIENA